MNGTSAGHTNRSVWFPIRTNAPTADSRTRLARRRASRVIARAAVGFGCCGVDDICAAAGLSKEQLLSPLQVEENTRPSRAARALVHRDRHVSSAATPYPRRSARARAPAYLDFRILMGRVPGVHLPRRDDGAETYDTNPAIRGRATTSISIQRVLEVARHRSRAKCVPDAPWTAESLALPQAVLQGACHPSRRRAAARASPKGPWTT